MRRLAALLAAVIVFAGAPLRAQTTPATPPAADPPVAARVVTAGARQAAEELLRLMNMEQVLRAGMEVTMDAQVEQQPLMAPFRATMQAWADRHLTWGEFGPKLTQIYAEEFTEAELRELAAFYRTPVGRKAAALAPALSRRGAKVGGEVAEAHMAELQEMIRARAAELQQPAGQRP